MLDASPTGDDVFFSTGQSLVKADPGLVDVYDARVDGGLPEPPPPAAGCEGEACQGAYAPPAAPTPASSLFQGPGNVKEGAKKKTCKKPKVERKGKCVTKKTHRRHKRHAKRGKGR
jgi:hypothetical protein